MVFQRKLEEQAVASKQIIYFGTILPKCCQILSALFRFGNAGFDAYGFVFAEI